MSARTALTDTERRRRHWDRHAGSYDKQMGFFDRKVFGDTRAWLCERARGQVLEVAVGTGLNLPWYPADTRMTGIDLSPEMLSRAQQRARQLDRDVELLVGDAQALDFPDACFDAVVCTFSLCAVPDARIAIEEMRRVLRPGGQLLLADHVVSTSRPARLLQATLEVVTVRWGGEHYRRRPINHVHAAGFTIQHHDRFALGIVERLVATKPNE